MGITKWRGAWGLSSVLGSLDVTPYEMAQAYIAFANYGQYIPLHAIDRITNSAGDILFSVSDSPACAGDGSAHRLPHHEHAQR